MSRKKDLLISVSAANLCFFFQWSTYLDPKYMQPYYESLGAYPESYLALLLNITVLSLFFFGGLRALHRFAWRHLALSPFLFFSLNGARLALNDHRISLGYLFQTLGYVPSLALGTVFFLLLGTVLLRFPLKAGGALRVLLTLLSPLLLFNVFKGAVFAKERLGKAPTEVTVAGEKTNPRKLVWLLFDGFDYRVSFPERPVGLKLPGIDGLRNTSYFATQSMQPADETSISIPSYFLGKSLSETIKYNRQGEFQYVLNGESQPRIWSVSDTFFSSLKQKNVRSGIAGWYLPYCQLLKSTVDTCFRLPHYDINQSPYTDSVLGSAVSFWKDLVFFKSSAASRHIRNYNTLLEKAVEYSKSPELDFVFIHLPIPHVPIIFNAKTGSLDPSLVSTPEGYFDNLILVDKTITAVRRALQKNGLWDSTTLLVSSDHASRNIYLHDQKLEERIPFLLKLPHQNASKKLNAAFNAVQTRKILERHFESWPLSDKDLMLLLRGSASKLSE